MLKVYAWLAGTTPTATRRCLPYSANEPATRNAALSSRKHLVSTLWMYTARYFLTLHVRRRHACAERSTEQTGPGGGGGVLRAPKPRRGWLFSKQNYSENVKCHTKPCTVTELSASFACVTFNKTSCDLRRKNEAMDRVCLYSECVWRLD